MQKPCASKPIAISEWMRAKMTQGVDFVAQVVEHLTFNQRVVGSSPTEITEFNCPRVCGGSFFIYAENAMKSNNLSSKLKIKLFFFALTAVMIGLVLIYTDIVVDELVVREKKNLKFFAELYQHVGLDDVENTVFIFDKVMPTISYPMIMTLDDDEPIYPFLSYSRNIKIDTSKTIEEQREIAKKLVCEMDESNEPIELKIAVEGDTVKMKIHYSYSGLVRDLRMFPIVELGVIGIFILLGYVWLTSIKRGEESKVWVGMAKETAHQLGTPLSSLLAWVEIIRYGKDDPALVENTCNEMQSDIDRLNTIATRFSKIGSTPELTDGNLSEKLNAICAYFDKRLPVLGKRIDIIRNIQDDITCKYNNELFAWVVENLLKNATDAIEEQTGTILVHMSVAEKKVHILITDNGKGMTKKQRKLVFMPGYTTKKRGWGLGLSLSKRIIEEYHDGRIYVKNSAPGKGTTFSIEIPYNY